ncbi:MAG: hypothetical protein ACQESF_01815 [Nanobdellota archaeon]
MKKAIATLATLAAIAAPSLGTIEDRVQTANLNPAGIVEVISPDEVYAGATENRMKKNEAIQEYITAAKLGKEDKWGEAEPHYRAAFETYKELGIRNGDYAAMLSQLAGCHMRMYENKKFPLDGLRDDLELLEKAKQFGEDYRNLGIGETDTRNAKLRQGYAAIFNITGNIMEYLNGCPRKTKTISCVDQEICDNYFEAEDIAPEMTFYKNANRCRDRGYSPSWK